MNERAGMSRAPRPRYGQWLREQRQARGWAVPDLIRRLRAAAASAGDRLPGNDVLHVMVYRWEDDRSGISERYRLHYCRALGIPVSEFGKPPPAQPQPEPRPGPDGLRADETALLLAEAGLMLLSASAGYLRDGGPSRAPGERIDSRAALELAGRIRAAQRGLTGNTGSLTWKVRAGQDVLFGGEEDKARRFLAEHAGEPDLALESPGGHSCRCQDGRPIPPGQAGRDDGGRG